MNIINDTLSSAKKTLKSELKDLSAETGASLGASGGRIVRSTVQYGANKISEESIALTKPLTDETGLPFPPGGKMLPISYVHRRDAKSNSNLDDYVGQEVIRGRETPSQQDYDNTKMLILVSTCVAVTFVAMRIL